MCFIILLLIGISTIFLLLKWDSLVCNSQDQPYASFSQTDIIALFNLLIVFLLRRDNLLQHFSRRVWCLSLTLMDQSALTVDTQMFLLWLSTPQAGMCHPLLYPGFLWKAQSFGHQHCCRIGGKVWKTPNISRSCSSSVTLKEQGPLWFEFYIRMF